MCMAPISCSLPELFPSSPRGPDAFPSYAMAPKGRGGIGNKSAQDYVAELPHRLGSEQEVRAQLKKDGYKAGRTSQLLKATRPAEGQAGPAAAAALPKQMARPAAAEPAVAARKKLALAAPALAPEAAMHSSRQIISV